jgi:hypothetical protein
MKNLISLLLVLSVTMLTSFAAEPEIKEIKLDKTELKPGEAVSVSIEFTGKPTEIQSVELFSREYYYDAPKMMMQLLGDGKNIWVFKAELPYDAPLGTYNVEVKALNKKGEEIVAGECNNCTYGPTGVFKFEVKQIFRFQVCRKKSNFNKLDFNSLHKIRSSP